VKLLVTLGADTDAETSEKKSAAYVAAYMGKASMVKLLGDLGANLNTHNAAGKVETPFQAAARKGHGEVTEYILAKRKMRGFKVNSCYRSVVVAWHLCAGV
jgi:ankyrin repeat protein